MDLCTDKCILQKLWGASEVFFSGNPFFWSALNCFLPCVYDIRSGGERNIKQYIFSLCLCMKKREKLALRRKSWSYFFFRFCFTRHTNKKFRNLTWPSALPSYISLYVQYKLFFTRRSEWEKGGETLKTCRAKTARSSYTFTNKVHSS